MAESGTLHDAFLDELRDAYDAEKQLLKALPKMAKAATAEELRAAFEAHLEETKGPSGPARTGVREFGEKGPRKALRWHRRHHRGRQVGDGGGASTMQRWMRASLHRVSGRNITRWQRTGR